MSITGTTGLKNVTSQFKRSIQSIQGFLARFIQPKRREHLIFLLFIAPNFVLFAVFTFWPLVYSLGLSFTRWNMIAPRPTIIGLDNYANLLKDDIFWLALRNTVMIAFGVVFVKLAIALGLAMVLNRPLAGRSLYRAIIFSPTFTSSVAIAMVWTWIFDPFYGLLRVPFELAGFSSPNWLSDIQWTVPSLVIVSIWQGIGYDMVIFLAGLQSVPRELYDAAKVDGATGWNLFRHITLPMISPTTFFLVITSIIGSFKIFDLVSVMTQGGPMNSSNVIIYYLYQNGFKFFRMGYASSIAIVFFVIVLLITIFQERLSKRWVHYS